jgi:hypothetical protein
MTIDGEKDTFKNGKPNKYGKETKRDKIIPSAMKRAL